MTLSLTERLAMESLQILAGVWFFTLGATIGSFLNVVVYRSPRGMSVVWNSSHCPHCQTAIRPIDNIPIISWLLLWGRCRACSHSISVRYLLVEITSALVFLSLAGVELFGAGVNLPSASHRASGGIVHTILDGQWTLGRIYLFHSYLLSALLAWSLIKADGHRLPRWGAALSTAVGLGLLACWPDLHPVLWKHEVVTTGDSSTVISGVIGAAVGTAAGIALGAVVGGAIVAGSRCDWRAAAARPETVYVLAIVGLFLGWQAAVAVTAMAGVTYLLGAVAARRWWALLSWPMIGHLYAAVLIQILLWRQLAEQSWWPGPNGSAAVFAVAGLLALVTAWLGATRRRIAEPQHREPLEVTGGE